MAWIAAAGAVAGGLLASKGGSSAAKQQAKATKAAIKEERRQYDQNRADLAPWRDTGSAAINRLGVLLGLTPRAGGSFTEQAPTREQFTRQGSSNLTANDIAAFNNAQAINPTGISLDDYAREIGMTSGGAFDQAGYDAAISDYNARKAAYDAQGADAGYGDLLKKFTLADFWDDPVTQASYQQGLDQGTKALANMAGARGNRNSGAQLKALTRFTEDYTGNQAAGSQARFVGDQTNLYNRLAGIAGSGQTAANTGVAAGQNTANTIGGLLTAQGNARGAAAIAKGNAYGGAIRNVGNIFGGYGNTGNNANYNAAGVYQPFYSGYGAAGDYQYG